MSGVSLEYPHYLSDTLETNLRLRLRLSLMHQLKLIDIPPPPLFPNRGFTTLL
jgi:hypothetical protein